VTGAEAEAALGKAASCEQEHSPYETQPPAVTSGVRIGTPA